MGQFVNLTSSDGTVVPAWVAEPDATTSPIISER